MQMKLFFALAISAISAASLPVHDHVDPRSLISRDSNAITKFREWMVAIEEGGVVRCGGMIISPTVVLTARGCAEVGHTIRAGARGFVDQFKLDGGKTYNISRIKHHPELGASIIILDKKFPIYRPFSGIGHVTKLPNAYDYKPAESYRISALGWSLTTNRENPGNKPGIKPTYPDKLMELKTKIISSQECKAFLASSGISNNADHYFCTKAVSPIAGTCRLVSGSSATETFNLGPGTIAGLAILRPQRCGEKGTPIVFLNIGSLMRWIVQQVPDLPVNPYAQYTPIRPTKSGDKVWGLDMSHVDTFNSGAGQGSYEVVFRDSAKTDSLGSPMCECKRVEARKSSERVIQRGSHEERKVWELG